MARNDTYYNRTETRRDPYDVGMEDPDNLLGLYDNVAPPTGGVPSALTQLEAFTPPARPAPEPVVGQGTGSYVEDAVKPATPAEIQEMYATGYPMKDVQEHIKRSGELRQKILEEGGGMTASRLQSTAPEWYKSGKPPTSHGGWADAANMLGSVASAGQQQALKDPRRPSHLKVQDAREVALAGGLSTLLSNLFTRGQTDFKANQDAALKEAQMMRTIPGSKTRTQLAMDASDNYIEQAHKARGLDSLVQNRKYNQDHLDAELNPDDPQAIAWRDSLIANNVPPDQVAGLGRKALQALAGTHNITLSAGHTAGQKVADAANKRAETVLQSQVDLDKDIQKRIFDETQRRSESDVPEIEWNNNSPPDKTIVDKARQLYRVKAGFSSRLADMQSIQARIEAAATKFAKQRNLPGGAAEAISMMGPLHEWVKFKDMPEMHDLVNDAKILQTAIQNLIRSEDYSNLGVMQKWEDLKTKMIDPLAGSPTGFLKGRAMWSALDKDVNRMWDEGVRAYGGHRQGTPDPGAAAGAQTPEQIRAQVQAGRSAPAPIVEYDPRTRQVRPTATATDDSLGTGSVPAPPPGAPPQTAEDKAKYDVARGRAGGPAPAPTAQAPAPKLEAGQVRVRINGKEHMVTPSQLANFKKQQAAKIADGTVKLEEL